MILIPSYDPAAFGTSGFRNGSASLFYQYSERTEVAQKQAKEITLYTEEGDQVTLSTSRQTQAVYTRNDAMGYRQTLAVDKNTAISSEQLVTLDSESFKLADSRTMTLSIEGDLNEEELADIKKALVQIDRIMMQQLQGQDVLTGVKRAENLLDLETIAGIEADYSYEKVVYTQQAASIEQLNISRGGSPPVIPADHAVDQMVDSLQASSVDPPKFIRPLQQLFANINKTIRNQIGSDPHAVDTLSGFISQVQEQLLSRIFA